MKSDDRPDDMSYILFTMIGDRNMLAVLAAMHGRHYRAHAVHNLRYAWPYY